MNAILFKQNNIANINFDLTPLFESIKSLHNDAIDMKRLYRIYKILNMFESSFQYAIVDKSNIDGAEETLAIIDDTIDNVEDEIEQSNIFEKFLWKRILSKLLTIEFILSNKVADYLGENHQNETL